MALKWAVTEKFSDYLIGSTFTAFTDNNPLTFVLGSAKLDAAGHRWVAQLANYHFNSMHRSGKSNIDADGLSRIKWPRDLSEQVSSDSAHAVLDTIHVDSPLIDAVSLSCDVVPSKNDVSDE